MTRILHLRRRLSCVGVPPACEGIRLRNFEGPDDINRWLALRREAFDVVGIRGREWNAADFDREFVKKPDWSPGRMWLADGCPPENEPRNVAGRIVGAVYLGMQGRGVGATGIIQWLMVARDWRRRGIGRLLVATLEADCWRRGVHQVACETHASWTAATAFYKSLGYAAGLA